MDLKDENDSEDDDCYEEEDDECYEEKDDYKDDEDDDMENINSSTDDEEYSENPKKRQKLAKGSDNKVQRNY